uniref:Uncharacterized protein n=1 Tax=Arion vulgaris TaxID=1028688 RepID=A0A0B7AJP3_9EUPU
MVFQTEDGCTDMLALINKCSTDMSLIISDSQVKFLNFSLGIISTDQRRSKC